MKHVSEDGRPSACCVLVTDWHALSHTTEEKKNPKQIKTLVKPKFLKIHPIVNIGFSDFESEKASCILPFQKRISFSLCTLGKTVWLLRADWKGGTLQYVGGDETLEWKRMLAATLLTMHFSAVQKTINWGKVSNRSDSYTLKRTLLVIYEL